MKKMTSMIAAAALCCGSLYAASLGDTISVEQKRTAQTTERPAIAATMLGSIEIKVYEAELTHKLVLPDAMSSGRRISPESDGYILLYVRGSFKNKSTEKQSLKDPRFKSASGKIFEGKTLYEKGKESQLFITLNPDENREFVTYFMLPVSDIIGGGILVADDNIFDSAEKTITLPFTGQTPVETSIIKRGITDNMFDTMD